ncbi:hypothetical protein [Paraburkholderia sp. J8-2]|uniref:hypothetical protein n=1 Tax=Paraburkholderia sp. J8-2 TaxID=2805440 RepID=UPI002AB7A3DD|nr:hypothetical protein [Paraburkholderia sp. J8-2]
MTHSKRRLIPDEQTIVVLDTSPVRDIGHHGVPAWVATFADMAKDGYVFSLADGACAELLSAHARGTSITDDELRTIIDAVEPFLNPDIPVMLGKVDIMRMIGEADAPAEWEAEVRGLSQRAWQTLKASVSTPLDKRVSAAAELQEDRDDWIGAFAKFDAGYEQWVTEDPNRKHLFPLNPYEHPLLDLQFASLATRSVQRHPDMAVRADLQLRYEWRQWVRSRQEKDGYNPSSKKKRNDGVDLDMYPYLMLPALMVAGESGFHSKIADIHSPQLIWIWEPQALADAWSGGERPRAAWVATAADRTVPQPVG